MSLTLSEVEHIASLARLDLTDEEKIRYRDQLSAVLDYAAVLQALDTTGIPPTASVLPGSGNLRPDQVGPVLPPGQLLQGSAGTENGQIKVPPIRE